MLETHEGQPHSPVRPRVVDVTTDRQPEKKRRQKKQRRSRASEPAENNNAFPIEMQPVIRATMEYAKRTHALGAMMGAAHIESLARRIRSLGPTNVELETILCDADVAAVSLRKALERVYEDA